MNNIGPRRLQHFLEIGVGCRDPYSLPQLFGHEHFPIANRHDLAIRDPPDGVDMLVSHLPTTYYGNAKHCRQRLEISFLAQKHSTTNTNSPAPLVFIRGYIHNQTGRGNAPSLAASGHGAAIPNVHEAFHWSNGFPSTQQSIAG